MKKYIIFIFLISFLVGCSNITEEKPYQSSGFPYAAEPSDEGGLGITIIANHQSVDDLKVKYSQLFNIIEKENNVGPIITVNEPNEKAIQEYNIKTYPSFLIFKKDGKPFITNEVDKAIKFIQENL